MGEHLYLHTPSGWPAYILAVNDSLDFLDLVEGQFPCQNNHVRKLGIETQGLGIGNAQLSGNVHLKADLAGIDYGRHVRCNDCRDACFSGCPESLAHIFQVFVVEDNIECKVSLYS